MKSVGEAMAIWPHDHESLQKALASMESGIFKRATRVFG